MKKIVKKIEDANINEWRCKNEWMWVIDTVENYLKYCNSFIYNV